MKSGKLAVVVIIATFAATILGGWALSTDVNEVTKTSYNELADITPLFNIEDAPEFVSYNSSANYTGYYQDPSTKYFEGVDYDTSSRANVYKLNLEPTSDTTSTLDLSQVTGDSSETWKLYYWASAMSPVDQTIEHLDIPSLITALSLESYDKLTFISDAGAWTTGGFFTFCTSAMENNPLGTALSHIYSFKNPNLSGNLLVPNTLASFVDASNVTDPILACTFDSLSNTVELFSDTNMTKSLGPFSPSAVSVIWSNSTSPGFHLGNTGTVNAIDLPPTEYLDITEGVELL